MEQDLADRLAQGRPARLAGHRARDAGVDQACGQSLGLGRLAGALRAFECQKEAASALAVEVHSTSLAEPKALEQVRSGWRRPPRRFRAGGEALELGVEADSAVGFAAARAREQVGELRHLVLEPADVGVLR